MLDYTHTSSKRSPRMRVLATYDSRPRSASTSSRAVTKRVRSSPSIELNASHHVKHGHAGSRTLQANPASPYHYISTVPNSACYLSPSSTTTYPSHTPPMQNVPQVAAYCTLSTAESASEPNTTIYMGVSWLISSSQDNVYRLVCLLFCTRQHESDSKERLFNFSNLTICQLWLCVT